jgi:hypothetical protein
LLTSLILVRAESVASFASAAFVHRTFDETTMRAPNTLKHSTICRQDHFIILFPVLRWQENSYITIQK